MSEENKTRARRAREITSPDGLVLIEEGCAPDLVWHEPDQGVRGIEEGHHSGSFVGELSAR
jgi:hypothetical protein